MTSNMRQFLPGAVILTLKECIVCVGRKMRRVLKCTAAIYWTSTVKNNMINNLHMIFKIFTNPMQGRYYSRWTNRETKCLDWLNKLLKASQLIRKQAPAPLLLHLLDQLNPRGLVRQKEALLSSTFSHGYSRKPIACLHGFGT